MIATNTQTLATNTQTIATNTQAIATNAQVIAKIIAPVLMHEGLSFINGVQNSEPLLVHR